MARMEMCVLSHLASTQLLPLSLCRCLPTNMLMPPRDDSFRLMNERSRKQTTKQTGSTGKDDQASEIGASGAAKVFESETSPLRKLRELDVRDKRRSMGEAISALLTFGALEA